MLERERSSGNPLARISPMTPLRQRMIEEMHLRNYSKHSIAAYVSAVYRLANHYGRSPDRLSREEIRDFLVDLVEEQHVSWPYYQQVLAALRYLLSACRSTRRSRGRHPWPAASEDAAGGLESRGSSPLLSGDSVAQAADDSDAGLRGGTARR